MQIPIIILHGWGASSKSFNKVRELLAQKGHSVFVMDLPGFGEAKPPAIAWSVDKYADYVLNYLKAQSIDKYILYGHSFGGRIAIKIAARQPEKLAGLILCDAAGVTPRPKLKIAFFSFLSRLGKTIFSLPFLRSASGFVRKAEYWLAGSYDYYCLQNPVMKKTFKNIIEQDLTSYLDFIQVPTLLIWGENDKMTPVSDAYLMHGKIQNNQLEILKRVGHSPHLENPNMLVNILNNFLQKLAK